MSAHTGPANANGHRRRQVRARVLAEETHCALCDQAVDKTLTFLAGQHGPRCTNVECRGCVPHPLRAEVDEDVPRARGGSAIERSNTRLMHRQCNGWKGTRTLAEARAVFAGFSAAAAAPPAGGVTNLVSW
jgi:5-methylcytosine-specific restriction endonuclease McrA